MIQSKEKALAIAAILDEGKADDIEVLELKKVSHLCDYFVICSASSSRHVKALADRLLEKTEDQGLSHVEGYEVGVWILMDYGDVIVHIFREPERAFYGLERLWGDAPRVSVTAKAKIT